MPGRCCGLSAEGTAAQLAQRLATKAVEDQDRLETSKLSPFLHLFTRFYSFWWLRKRFSLRFLELFRLGRQESEVLEPLGALDAIEEALKCFRSLDAQSLDLHSEQAEDSVDMTSPEIRKEDTYIIQASII